MTRPSEMQQFRSKQVIDRNSGLKRLYGLTTWQVDQLWEAQDRKCAICSLRIKTYGPNNEGKAHVDHDHETGKVRALLCGACNRGLGHFRDNPDIVKKAEAYLRYHKA